MHLEHEKWRQNFNRKPPGETMAYTVSGPEFKQWDVMGMAWIHMLQNVVLWPLQWKCQFSVKVWNVIINPITTISTCEYPSASILVALEQDRQCTYNTTRSCNHCCSGKATSITCSECVCVCGLRYWACNAQAPYFDLWPVWLYSTVFAHVICAFFFLFWPLKNRGA
jgi:hypothetical protein